MSTSIFTYHILNTKSNVFDNYGLSRNSVKMTEIYICIFNLKTKYANISDNMRLIDSAGY